MFRSIALVAATSLCACATPHVVSVAHHGSLAELGSEIRAAKARGELDARTTRKLALAVAERVVASAHAPDGPALLDRPGECRRRLVDAYQLRARGRDASAASATAALFEDGVLDAEELVLKYQASTDPAWLAVAARAATLPERATWRNALMLHPDTRVRRAAMRAALTARSNENLEEVLAASRLDPDPQTRRLAIHALGALGTYRAMVALQDRWTAGTTAVRIAVVEAWSSGPAYANGGREALERVALGRGRPAVAAVVALLRARRAPPGWANDVLARMLEQGTEDEQLTALTAADAAHERTTEALLKIAAEASPRVQLAAQNALLRNATHRPEARARLLAAAKKSDPLAVAARTYLAKAGDVTVVPMLEKQLTSRKAVERVGAAVALTGLGLQHKAVDALLETRPSDRLTVACAMVTAPHQ